MNFLKRHWVLLACAVLALAKIALCAGMPLDIHVNASYDDAWAVRAADFLASGQWLGPYDDIALIKNPGFPLWLALCSLVGAGYLVPTAVLYVLAAAFFTAALRPLLRRDWMMVALFALVLFCPVSFATDTFQRIYRNSITAAQALLVFGAYLGIYLRLRKPLPHLAPWAAVGVIALPWFWLSREDSIWVAPFVLVATVVMIALVAKGHPAGQPQEQAQTLIETQVQSLAPGQALGQRLGQAPNQIPDRAQHDSQAAGTVPGKPRQQKAVRHGAKLAAAALVLLPLLSCMGAVQGVKALNAQHYGVAVTAEINSGNFARMVKDLYAIDPAYIADVSDSVPGGIPANQRVAVTHAALMQAYTASPTLACIKDQVEDQLLNWGDTVDNDQGDGEVNGGEFFWVLRRAARDAGVYSADDEERERLLRTMTDGLSADSAASTRTALIDMPPARFADAFYGLIADELEDALEHGKLPERATMPSSIMTPWRSEYAGQLVPTAFGIILQTVGYGDVTAYPQAADGSDDGIAYFERITGGSGYREGAPTPLACTVGEGVIWVYRIVGPLLALAGLVGFVVCAVRYVRSLIACRHERKAMQSADEATSGATLLVLVAVLLGVLTLIAGLTYSRISSFVPINYYYYGSAAYPLLLAFNAVALLQLVRSRIQR